MSNKVTFTRDFYAECNVCRKLLTIDLAPIIQDTIYIKPCTNCLNKRSGGKIYADRIKAISSKYNHDKERAHWETDNVLIELLAELGYPDVVAAWKQVDKWYT